MSALLQVRGLTVRHGGLLALDRVDLDVEEGAIVGLIGPNGAGKTTCIDTVSGFVTAAGGTVVLDGHDLTTAPPHVRARRGLVRTFQSLELFDDLTVRDNVEVAASSRGATDRALDLVGVAADADRFPTQLPGGRRQLVALARALAAAPALVLLDEPAAGLDPDETAELSALVRTLPEHGTAVLIVDHDMSLILGACDRVDVLDFGRRIASGPPEVVRHDPLVVEAYLGTAS